jgi:phenylalanyl-tRNA synthetase beta subunit
MRGTGPDWLRDVSIVDLYEHMVDEQAVRTFTYALTFLAEGADLTTEQLNGATDAAHQAVIDSFGHLGVVLR